MIVENGNPIFVETSWVVMENSAYTDLHSQWISSRSGVKSYQTVLGSNMGWNELIKLHNFTLPAVVQVLAYEGGFVKGC